MAVFTRFLNQDPDAEYLVKRRIVETIEAMDLVEFDVSRDVETIRFCDAVGDRVYFGDTHLKIRLREHREPPPPLNYFGTGVHRLVEIGGERMCSCLSEYPCPIEFDEDAEL